MNIKDLMKRFTFKKILLVHCSVFTKYTDKNKI